MSNQSGEKRNSLTDALSWLGSVGLAYAVFMGMMYASGSVWIAAVVGLVAFLLTTALRLYLLTLKKRKESYKNKTPERILLGVFAVIIVASFVLILHYIYIEYDRKTYIKDVAQERLDHVSDMVESAIIYAEYKVDSFEIAVDKRMESYLNNNYQNQAKWNSLVEMFSDGDARIKPNLENRGYRYDKDLRARVERQFRLRVAEAKAAEAEFKRDYYNINYLRSENRTYIKNTRPVFTDWNFMSIQYTYDNISDHYSDLYQTARSKMPDFSYPSLPFHGLRLDDPFYALKRGKTDSILFALLAAGVLSFLILSDYLFYRRVLPDVRLIDKEDAEEDEDDLRKKRILEKTRGNN